MAVAAFVYADWAARYPELSGVTSGAAAGYFAEACLYLDNSDASVVQDINKRTTLLYMLTAHIAQLYSPTTSQGGQQLVGRIASATQGSVSVNTAMTSSEQAEWYNQTKYGASYWRAAGPYRSARYIGPTPASLPATPY